MHVLGKGAFGEVYLVRHKRKNILMALKQMDKAYIESQNKVEHIKNEKRVLIQGKSQFLVRIYYSFQTPDSLYLAMEYCSGGDLGEFMKMIGSLEEEEAQLYFAEMIMAVHVLHKMGYIHRDLKPANFLIDGKGHLKLADFGLSKNSSGSQIGGLRKENVTGPHCQSLLAQSQKGNTSLSASQPGATKNSYWQQNGKVHTTLAKRQTKLSLSTSSTLIMRSNDVDAHRRIGGQTGLSPTHYGSSPTRDGPVDMRKKMLAYSVVGSPDYMSPEVTSGLQPNGEGSKGYGEEVDWWSLGCVFVEVLLGDPPFQGETPEEVFNNILNWETILPDLLNEYKLYTTAHCFELISGLLCEQSVRLGKDIQKVQQLKFFEGLDWNHLDAVTAHFIPSLENGPTEEAVNGAT